MPTETTKHTPGPWTAFGNSPGDDSLPSVMAQQSNDGGLFYVAQCNRIEDARLIALAPEMRITLTSFVAHTEGAYDGDTNYMEATLSDAHPWRIARDLLRRIDGGTDG